MKTKNYQIKWKYGRGDTKVFTYCYLTPLNKFEPIQLICGHAECASTDHFSRDKGRKISLARALKKTDLPKQERAEIWETYRNMKKGGRW